MMNEETIINRHKPVMLAEVLSAFELDAPLNLKESEKPKIIDATLGTAGHSMELAKNGAQILGIETDSQMLDLAKQKLTQTHLVHDNFLHIDTIAAKYNFCPCDGILFDLGVNTLQLISDQRGLSFSNPNAPLDMRLDPISQSVTAADLLNALHEDAIFEMFNHIVDWKQAKRLAAKIVSTRQTKKFIVVNDLLVIAGDKGTTFSKLHPATKVFLALRIAVNSELENLSEALPKSLLLLKPGGRLVVISFHSLEDRIVKKYFRNVVREGRAMLVTKKPLVPSQSEKETNRNSRSAKLRILQKI